jgi:predicted GIY-YIG superfamily endonuclease
MATFYYVYILLSHVEPTAYYTGLTEDLTERLKRHNAGDVPHTSKLKPWYVELSIAFRDRHKASEFERYLKSGSGREFATTFLAGHSPPLPRIASPATYLHRGRPTAS